MSNMWRTFGVIRCTVLKPDVRTAYNTWRLKNWAFDICKKHVNHSIISQKDKLLGLVCSM